MSYPVPMAALGMSSGVIIEDGSQLLQNLELGSALLNVLFTIYDVDEKIAAARTHPQGHPSTMRYGPPSSSASTSSPPSSSSSSFSSSSSPSPSYTSSSDASSASSHSSSYYSSHLASSSQSITSFEYDGGATVLTPPRPSSEEDSSFLIQSQAERLHVVLDAVSSVGNGGNGTSASTSLSPMVHLLIGAEQVFEPSLVYLLALEIYEQAAVDDHKVAHAVQDGRELPPVTRCQSLTQNERFYRVVMDGVDGLGDPEEDGTGIRKRVYRVVAALIRQADIDFHREIVAWKSQQVIPDRTYCQLLVEHPLFVTLFTMACKAYRVELRRQIAMVQMAQAAAKMKARANVECTSCCDTCAESECLRAPCGHPYCPSCVTMLVESSIKDEASFPPQCCKKVIDGRAVAHFLDPRLRSRFAAACFEYGTPPPERVYCPNAQCSSFIGPRGTAPNIRCRACGVGVCTKCKNQTHPGDNCEQNQLLEQVRQLAKKSNWKDCPRCHSIIEKMNGCNHMVCRCGQEFCYRCGTPWKKCSC